MFPIIEWGREYKAATLISDLVAALIVTIMLIPQSLAYAMLAGLPPEVGLYASIAPLIIYAFLGSSRVLAVGPVAVASLMTAAAIGELAQVGTPQYWHAAMLLALLSGAMLLVLGLLRLGFLANFLSHPVIAGFVSASGVIIAASQLKHILGVSAEGHNLFELLGSLGANASGANLFTMAVGVGAMAFLFWARRGLRARLLQIGLNQFSADLFAKTGPVVTIALTTWLVWWLELGASGVAIVGLVPGGLPPLTLPQWDPALWADLAGPAFLIGVVGFAESVSVGQTLAAKRRQRVDPDQELVALGASNMAASFTGGFPVTGGFSRSVVNYDAGAQTPAAGLFTAAGLALASLYLTPALYFLPRATLAATIIVAVLSLVDWRIFGETWSYAKADFAALVATLVMTLIYGVEIGLVAGVAVSVALFLYRTSRPHIAVVGLVPGTESFRNVLRHDVQVDERVMSLRVDESLYFANARFLEDQVNELVADNTGLEHLVLQCSAINDIDSSALHSLEAIGHRLQQAGVTMHLSEVKGPVMDRLSKTPFLEHLSGRVFLTHFQAIRELSTLGRPEFIGNGRLQRSGTGSDGDSV